MALGFGKKKGDDAGQQKSAPADQGSAELEGDTLAFGGQDFEGDTFAFDADPDSLEQFASELEAIAPSPTAGKAPSANAVGTDWDADSLLGDLDAFAAPAGGADPNAHQGHGQPETTLFDDLAMELEGIPGMASDHQAPPAAPKLERRTRRKSVSPDISAPGAMVKGTKDPKAKGKLPLIPIVGGMLVLAVLGGGLYMMKAGGSSDATDDTAIPTPARPKPRKTVEPSATGVKPPVSVTPAAAVKPVTPAGVPPVNHAASPVPTVKPATSATKEPPLDDMTKKLRKLWEEGRDAKHNKDIAAARKYWEEGLKLAPDNIGFKESLAKLDEAK